MRKFQVIVNGASYEVIVEETTGAAAPVAAPVAPAPAAPVPVAAPAAAPVAAAAGQESIVSPMPGNIMSVNVKAGESVKSGQVLLVLEAMKMENEIMAPRDGVVAAVNVAVGATVNTGDVLCVLS